MFLKFSALELICLCYSLSLAAKKLRKTIEIESCRRDAIDLVTCKALRAVA